MYAMIVTIISADKRGDVVGTIRGAGSILDLVEGRDPEPSDPTIFNRYVLKPSLLPVGTPEIPCVAFVGINADVPAVVRNEYSQNSALWRTVEFNGYNPPIDRAFMQNYLKNLAVQNSCDHGWQIIPGDTLTGITNLLTKFVAIP